MSAGPHRPVGRGRRPPLIGIVTFGIASYLNPLLILAGKLDRLGYRVTFVSTSDVVADAAASANHLFFRLHDSGAERVAELESAISGYGALWRRLQLRARRAIAEAQCQSFQDGHGLGDFVESHRPAAVWVMAEMHEYIVFLAGTGVPLVLLDTHLATRRRPGLPPPNYARVPTATLISRLQSRWAWCLLTLRRRVSRGLRRLELGRAERITALRRLADRRGLHSARFLDLRQWHFVDYPTLPLLRLATPALDFPGGAEERVAYSGALIGDWDRIAPCSLSDQGAWQHFVERQNALGRPLVLCSLGSFMSDGGFLRRVIAATRDQHWSLLVASGPGCGPAEFGALPANVAVFSWLPQLRVLEHADAMICAGGNATINECIVHGVPMLVYPLDRMDQCGMSARVVYHGLGLRGDLAGEQPATIGEKLRRLLQDRAIRQRVEAMRREYADYAGTDRPGLALSHVLERTGNADTAG